jgi:hypothetical protein
MEIKNGLLVIAWGYYKVFSQLSEGQGPFGASFGGLG